MQDDALLHVFHFMDPEELDAAECVNTHFRQFGSSTGAVAKADLSAFAECEFLLLQLHEHSYGGDYAIRSVSTSNSKSTVCTSRSGHLSR